ncbi:hypothetical protein DOJK_01514 [Patescibacteria group bacterium]|nr:hypothetical protein DOJK_01514 [Patescibacteria group bacterium]
MPVQIVIDYFNIDNQTAYIVENNQAAIDAARLKVYQQLRANDETILRLRISNLALYKHFRDFEGSKGFSKVELKPRALLTERFKNSIPDWLSDNDIVALDLLKNNQAIPLLAIEEQLLLACHEDLLSDNFQIFLSALAQQSLAFLDLIKKDSIKKRLHEQLLHYLNTTEAADCFIKHLLQSADINVFCQSLAYQRCLHYLRCFVNEYNKSLALPAQTLPNNLLTALPLLPLAEKDAQQLPSSYLSVLNTLNQKTMAKEIQPELLAQLLIIDWDSIWTELARLTENNPLLITSELVRQLENMNSALAQKLAKQYHAFLNANSYPLLPENAAIDEALEWSVGYFDYLRPILLNKQTPSETISQSFSTWLLNQSARIARSNSDWRYCSKQIDKYLAENYLVIVIMIDALSVLNQDILLAELNSFEHLNNHNEILFSPLPTLTEVGKMAVLTGQHGYLLPSDNEKAISQRYAVNTKIIKSWEDTHQHIDAKTQLVIFFENRLDDKLHDSRLFSDYREDILPTIKQLKRTMQTWLKDAGQRDTVFLITADHGMTVSQGHYTEKLTGDIKERTIKLSAQQTINSDFFIIKQDTKESYAVIKTRQTLIPANLTHGGLTPEEVLIPLISFTTKPVTPCRLPIDITVLQCSRLGNQYWQVELSLNTVATVENIMISLEPPFKLETRQTIDIIRAGKYLTIYLKITADCEQQGLIALNCQLNYDTALGHEKNNHALTIEFPDSLLDRDADSQDFEDMFS